jgi:hypothetical protein
MSERENILTIKINLNPGNHPNDLYKDTDQLRDELEDLDVKSVDIVRKEKLDPNAKGIEMFVLGNLIIKLAPVILPSLIQALNSWLSRHKGRTLKLTLGEDSIEIGDISSKEQEIALQEFIKSHQ